MYVVGGGVSGWVGGGMGTVCICVCFGWFVGGMGGMGVGGVCVVASLLHLPSIMLGRARGAFTAAPSN